MKTETPFAMSISEFNTLTASSFTNTSDTLDTPSQYAGFGAIAAQLATNAITEAYCFKFNQTPTSGGYDAKNGMHYVDNDNAPYNVGGVTKAGEVWRLFNKAAAPGRNRLGCTSGSLDTVASYDPATQFYHVFSASDSSSAISVTNNFSAWNIPATNQILVEEVSSTCSGGVRYLTNLTSSQTLSLSHGANSVLLYTIPTRTQQPLTNIVATEDATVSDGANSTVNFNAATNLLVSNNSTDASPRNVALVKFQLPAFNPGAGARLCHHQQQLGGELGHLGDHAEFAAKHSRRHGDHEQLCLRRRRIHQRRQRPRLRATRRSTGGGQHGGGQDD